MRIYCILTSLQNAPLLRIQPPCKVTPVILYGVVTGVTLHGVVSPDPLSNATLLHGGGSPSCSLFVADRLYIVYREVV